jgi:hypothetical protein
MSHLFISYSQHDSDLAIELQTYLEDKIAGLKAFVAERNIELGEEWEQRLYNSLRESFAVVPIMTKHWEKSGWCFAEWIAAKVLRIPLLPIVDSKAELERPELFRGIQGVQIKDKEQIEDRKSAYRQLDVQVRQKFNEYLAKHDYKTAPFPRGFRYEEDDDDKFSGRQREVDQILDRISTMRDYADEGGSAIFLHGISGCGKSALLRAGVYPKLKKSSGDKWLVSRIFQTTGEPFNELLLSFAEAFGQAGYDKSHVASALSAANSGVPTDMCDALERLVKPLSNHRSLAIVVDNIDRYVSPATDKDPEKTRQLLSLLVAAVRTRAVMLVGVLRSDQLEPVEQAIGVSSLMEKYERVQIEPLESLELISGVNNVLSNKGYDYDPMLLMTVYNDMGGSVESWPMIGTYLHNLWERAADADKKTAFKLKNYNDRGKIKEYIERLVRGMEADLGGELHNFFEFLALEGVSYVIDQRVVPRPIPKTRIPEKYEKLIERKLQDAGMCVLGLVDAHKNPAIQIVPVVIEKHWPKANLAERASKMDELLGARRAVRRWIYNDRHADWLVHRGGRLRRVRNLMEEHRLEDPELRDYLAECANQFA